MSELSVRRNLPFIPVSRGARPDPSIEHELFGHSRGSYIDAIPSLFGWFVPRRSPYRM